MFKRRLGIAIAVAAIGANPYHATPLALADGGYDTLSREQIQALILDRAAAHGANAIVLACVVERESRFKPSARGASRERGLVQWLPGRGNAWDATSAWRISGIDIIREYERENPDAVYFDIDAAAELFSKPRAVRQHHWRSTIRGCE